MIRHSTSGNASKSNRLFSGSSTLQMVARASASIDRGATTVCAGDIVDGQPGVRIDFMRIPFSVDLKAALGAATGGYGPILDLD